MPKLDLLHMDRDKREARRSRRQDGVIFAWLMIALPGMGAVLAALGLGKARFPTVAEVVIALLFGGAMLLRFKRRPGVPEHVAGVELVRHDDDDGPDVTDDSFYLPWCDCGWLGADHFDEDAARHQARQHAQYVFAGLRAWRQ